VNQRLITRKTKRAIQTLTCALAAVGLVCAASASVTYQVNNGGLESFNVKIDNTVINGALAGGILINQVSSSDPSMPKSYVTVCTDIEGTLYLGQSYQYNTPVTPFAGETGIAPTWGLPSNGSAAAEAIQNAAYLFYTYGQLTSTGVGLGTTTLKAALQLAVWDALYNTTTTGDIVSGSGARFKVTAGDQAAITQANAWIAALNNLNDEGDFGLAGYLLTPSSSKQPNGWYTDGKPPQGLLIAVPEAPTVIAGALLLLPFAASAFKILRRKHAASNSANQ